MTNVDQALKIALHAVSRDLGTDVDYEVKANLYKLLLYDEECFFARHRDSERLDGMFATLVLELPSIYEGAELSVFSPLTPDEKATYTFNGGGDSRSTKTKKRSTRLRKPGLHFAAFYADCYHEVSKLTSGHRVVLTYHLTATPRTQRILPHLPAPSPSPSQPADESVARRLSKLIELFSREDDGHYPEAISCDGKPKKLAVVLSHWYSPASLIGIESLKGSDRSIAELIRAAAHCSPVYSDVPSLARLAARKILEASGEKYATDPDFHLAHQLVSSAYKGNKGGPYFDAVISLANVWDKGESTPYTSTFCTTGPLLPLTGEQKVPLDLGPALRQHDIDAAYHPSWYGWEDDRGPPFQYFGPVDDGGWPLFDFWGPPIYGEQYIPDDDNFDIRTKKGNHSLPIYSHELLFASEEASREFREKPARGWSHMHKKEVVVWKPQEVEFCEYNTVSHLIYFIRIDHISYLAYPIYLQSEMGHNTTDAFIPELLS